MIDPADDPRLMSYLYGELDDAEMGVFEADLARNGVLSEPVRAYQSLLEIVREDPVLEPAPELDAVILAEAQKLATQGQEPRSTKERWQSGWWSEWAEALRRFVTSPAYGAVAVGAVAVAVLVVTLPMVGRDMPAEQAPLNEALPDRTPMRASMRARGAEKPESLPAAQPADVDDLGASGLGASGLGASGPAKSEVVAEGRLATKSRSDKKPAASADSDFGRRAGARLADSKDERVPAGPKRPQPREVRQPEPEALALSTGAEGVGLGGGGRGGLAEGAKGTGDVRSRRAQRRLDTSGDRSEEKAAADDGRTRAEQAARTLLEAVDREVEAKNDDAARRILRRARANTQGYAVYGRVMHRWAEFELSRNRDVEALDYAKIAAMTPGYEGRRAAFELVERVASRLHREDEVAWARRNLRQLSGGREP
ncbi:MAG: hypothetical protein H6729_16760 [Deltaproteobacteria bacterium]|nr:hypothetical protein [Deltaproteobacteria bacterium]